MIKPSASELGTYTKVMLTDMIILNRIIDRVLQTIIPKTYMHHLNSSIGYLQQDGLSTQHHH